MILLAILAMWMLVSKYLTYEDMSKLEYDMQLATTISKLVHETQKERGMTAGFLGSQGKKFSDKIKKQRQNTDLRLDELKQFYSSYEFTDNISTKISTVIKRLDKLCSKRQAVNTFSIKLNDALAYYTKINTLALEVISEISAYCFSYCSRNCLFTFL